MQKIGQIVSGVSNILGLSTNTTNASNEPPPPTLVDLTTAEAPTTNDRPATNSKRKEASEAQEQSGQAKQVKLNKNERFLVQNFGRIPADAQPLRPSKDDYNAQRDWFGPQKIATPRTNMHGYKPPTTFKPANTLNKPTKQAAGHMTKQAARNSTSTRNANSTPSMHGQSLAGPRQSQLDLTQSTGGNVSQKRTLNANIDSNVGRETKRQKRSGATNRPAEIDLTGETPASDDIFGHTLGRADRKRRSGSFSSRHSRASGQPPKVAKANIGDSLFPSTSFDNHSQWTGPAVDTGRSPEGLSSPKLDVNQLTTRASQDGRDQWPNKRPRVDTAPRDRPPSRKALSRRNSPETSQKAAAQLTIDLDKGIDEAAEQHRLKYGYYPQGSTADLEGTGKVLKNAMQRKATSNRPAEGTRQVRQAGDRVAKGAPSRSSASEVEEIPPVEQPLRNRFKRIDDGAMRAEAEETAPVSGQRNSHTVKGEQDVDELEGPPTVSSARKSVLTTQYLRTQAQAQPQPRQSRASSPSDLHPTRFKQARPVPKTPIATPRRSDDAVNHEEEGISVKLILSQPFASQQKGMEIVWLNSEKQFHVQCNGTVFIDSINGTPVTIGKREVNICWTEGRDTLRVHLKGSSSQQHCGDVLLEFDDDYGLSRCWDLLLYASGDTVKYKTEEPELFDKTFRNLSNKLSTANERYRNRRRTSLSGVAPKEGLPNGRFTALPDGEQIVYENDDEVQPSRNKIRSKMQGGDSMANALLADDHQRPRDAGQENTTSKYFPTEPIRRSTRQPKPVRPKSPSPPPRLKWTEVNNPKPWPHSVVYPAQGPRGVTVDFSDLSRLDYDQFLNDNIINFELRYIEETMAPEHRRKVHFFNTYFYTALTSKKGKKGIYYDAVSKWTKKVDLFKLPYIVVPVNIDMHWFVVIICNMQNLWPEKPDVDEAEVVERGGPTKSDEKQLPAAGEPPTAVSDTVDAPTNADENSDVFQFDADGKIDDSRVDAPEDQVGGAAGAGKKKKKPGLKSYDLDQPILISMDSFGLARANEMRHLKHYLSEEARDKRKKTLNTGELQGMTAKGLPEQPDFHNCGVYLLAYVAAFARNPDEFVRQVLQREIDQNASFADFDPDAKREEIRNRLIELQEAQETQRKTNKKAKKLGQGAPFGGTNARMPPASQVSEPPPSSATVQQDANHESASVIKESAAQVPDVATQPRGRSVPSTEEDDDLPVSPPRTKKHSEHVNQQEGQQSSVSSANRSTSNTAATSTSRPSPRAVTQSTPNVFEQNLPYERNDGNDTKDDLLTDLENNIGVTTEDKTAADDSDDTDTDETDDTSMQNETVPASTPAKPKEAIVLELGDEDETVIPDSQEALGQRESQKQSQAKHTYFD